jgi:hypothetical protein
LRKSSSSACSDLGLDSIIGRVDPATDFGDVFFVEGTTTTKGKPGPLMPRKEEELQVGEGPREGEKAGLDLSGSDYVRGREGGREDGFPGPILEKLAEEDCVGFFGVEEVAGVGGRGGRKEGGGDEGGGGGGGEGTAEPRFVLRAE